MNRISKKSFGNFVREHRVLLGYTQEELAKIVHVSGAVVSKWERGIRFPDYEILEDVAAALGVTLQELYDGSKTEEKQSSVRIGIFIVGLFAVGLLAGGILISAHQKKTEPAATEKETESVTAEKEADTVSFYAVVVQYNESSGTLLVEGISENDVNHRGSFVLCLSENTVTDEKAYLAGSQVCVVYRGEVLEIYPAEITDVVSVTAVDG